MAREGRTDRARPSGVGPRLGVLTGVTPAMARTLHAEVAARSRGTHLGAVGLRPAGSEASAVSGSSQAPSEAEVDLVLSAMHSAVLTSYETAASTFQCVEPVLDDVVFHELDASRRLELIRAAEIVANRAQAAVVRHAVALAQDPRFGFRDAHGQVNSAAEEIGLALGKPAPTVSRWLKAGRQLFGRLFPTGAALESGELGLEKALVIAEALETTQEALAFAVQDVVLPAAPQRTVREIKAEIARLLVELDPERADARHREARARRTVSRLMPQPDGMASFRVHLPADCAATVEEALARAYGTARAQGDSRTRSQVRADALSTWALDSLSAGGSLALFDWPGDQGCGGAAAPVPANDAAPAASGDAGPIPASDGARALASDGARVPRVLERISIPPGRINVTIPLEVLAHAIPGWSPPPTPLARVMDEVMGYGPEGGQQDSVDGSDQGAEPSTGLTTPGGPFRSANGAGPASAAGPTSTDVIGVGLGATDATPVGSPVAADTHRDGRIEAAWLEGYGPIPGALARLLAAGGTWRRIVTDTRTGAPLDVGRAAYSPPTAIVEAVRLVDQTCSRPGCTAPAAYCDDDHVTEWADGGATSLANLALLCRRCHRLKSLGAGRLTSRASTGQRTWTSTLGNAVAKPQVRPPRKVIARSRSGSGSGDDEPSW